MRVNILSYWCTRLAARWQVKIPERVELEQEMLRKQYGSLFDDVAALLFKHDPIGINFDDNTDEYESEARTILPRLNHCHSTEDALRVVHEEFVRWFDPSIAGPQERYTEIAAEIWQLWQGYLRR